MCKFITLVFITVFIAYLPLEGQIKQNSYSYDYSKIANHPRLLLTKEDEKSLRLSFTKSPEFKKVDNYVIKVSDSLLAEKPLVFHKEGKRLLTVSRNALTRLYYLSYSYRITKDKKYLNRAEEELNAVCSFESWNPTHFLDVGEMCMAVSIAYDWLYEDLKEDTRKLVRKAIVEKAFKPSYVTDYTGFLNKKNNWNSVCNTGLVFGALAIFEDEKEQCIAIIERSLESNKLALEVYVPDGNYPEGPGYWDYGTSFQVMLFAALKSALGSDNGLSKSPGFFNSAYYMLFSKGISGNYFNYYDCSTALVASSSLFWFANELNDPSLISQELRLIQKGVYTNEGLTEIKRILPNVLVFGKDLNISKKQEPNRNMFVGNGVTPVAIMRTDWEDGKGKYFGIKGGSASGSHAHMDQGSFVYEVGKLRWAMDFGMQNYFSLESNNVDLWNFKQNSPRWDVFRLNNLNHNTLTINNQRHNVNGKAEIVKTFDEKNKLGVEIDLKPVLNLNDELKTVSRKVTLINKSYLKIEDSLETNLKPVSLRWNMATHATAEIFNGNTIKLSQQGKTMLLKFESNIAFKLAIRPSKDPSQYKCEFGDYNYATYNEKNRGTVMVGFDAVIPANSAAKFTVRFEER